MLAASAPPQTPALASAATLATAQLACTAAQALATAAACSQAHIGNHKHTPNVSNTNGALEHAISVSDAVKERLGEVVSVLLDLTEACVAASSELLASGDGSNAAKVGLFWDVWYDAVW